MIIALILLMEVDRGDAARGVVQLGGLNRAVLGDPAGIGLAVAAHRTRIGKPTPGAIGGEIGKRFRWLLRVKRDRGMGEQRLRHGNGTA